MTLQGINLFNNNILYNTYDVIFDRLFTTIVRLATELMFNFKI